MKQIFKLLFFFLLVTTNAAYCATMNKHDKGFSTYDERVEGFISSMNHDTELINGNPKYMVPFCASRLIKDYQVRATNSALLDMYGHLIDGKDAYLAKKGSDLDFFAHSTMHLYMLCKNKLTPDVQSKIKDFMELHNFIRCEGTLNMRMMTFSAGFIASEEWSDFTDSEGHDARSIFN